MLAQNFKRENTWSKSNEVGQCRNTCYDRNYYHERPIAILANATIINCCHIFFNIIRRGNIHLYIKTITIVILILKNSYFFI